MASTIEKAQQTFAPAAIFSFSRENPRFPSYFFIFIACLHTHAFFENDNGANDAIRAPLCLRTSKSPRKNGTEQKAYKKRTKRFRYLFYCAFQRLHCAALSWVIFFGALFDFRYVNLWPLFLRFAVMLCVFRAIFSVLDSVVFMRSQMAGL